LGQWPTPLDHLARVSEYLDVHLDIKRDDLSGLALGGNKTRKLEPILTEAVKQRCDAVITAGAAQSNHCRQTAAAAAKLGMECHLVLGGDKDSTPQGNLLLDGLLGAHIYWAKENRKGEDIPQIKQALQDKGRRPYVVPYGGSNALGASAYVTAVEELTAQVNQRYSHVVFASSSGGTHAGLALGNSVYSVAEKIVGINIDKSETNGDLGAYIIELANQTATLLGLEARLVDRDIHLNSEYLGDGYGVIGQAEKEAISLLASHEGILLDPVYSGRAFAGLLGMVRAGDISRGSRVLFWHTGGAPALFAYSQQLT